MATKEQERVRSLRTPAHSYLEVAFAPSPRSAAFAEDYTALLIEPLTGGRCAGCDVSANTVRREADRRCESRKSWRVRLRSVGKLAQLYRDVRLAANRLLVLLDESLVELVAVERK